MNLKWKNAVAIPPNDDRLPDGSPRLIYVRQGNVIDKMTPNQLADKAKFDTIRTYFWCEQSEYLAEAADLKNSFLMNFWKETGYSGIMHPDTYARWIEDRIIEIKMRTSEIS